MTDWVTITRRNARSVQTTIGWIFWDPGAVARFEALGLPGPVGYIAARCAPLAPAGHHAVTAAFGSIRPAAIEFTFALVEQQTDFASVWAARDDAVREGLQLHAPDVIDALLEFGPAIWELIPSLPTVGRPFYASHLSMTRSCDPVLDAWHGVNLLREWRGDTHWALVVAAGLTGIEASVLHNAWLGYERDWLPSSRGSSAEEISIGWQSLEDRGLVADGEVTPTGIASTSRMRPTLAPRFRGNCSATSRPDASPRCSNPPASACCAGSTRLPDPTASRRHGCADPIPDRVHLLEALACRGGSPIHVRPVPHLVRLPR